MTYHGKIFLLPKHRFFPSGRGTMGEMGLFWKKRGAREKMVVHYVALKPIVWLLVASINRPLSGCLNQNDSNTSPVMMPPHPETGWRGQKQKRMTGREERVTRNLRRKTRGWERPRRQIPPACGPPSCFHLVAVRSWLLGEANKTQHLPNQTSSPVREGEARVGGWREKIEVDSRW